MLSVVCFDVGVCSWVATVATAVGVTSRGCVYVSVCHPALFIHGHVGLNHVQTLTAPMFFLPTFRMLVSNTLSSTSIHTEIVAHIHPHRKSGLHCVCVLIQCALPLVFVDGRSRTCFFNSMSGSGDQCRTEGCGAYIFADGHCEISLPFLLHTGACL